MATISLPAPGHAPADVRAATAARALDAAGAATVSGAAAVANPTAAEIKLLRAMVAQPSFSGEEVQVAKLLARQLNASGWQAGLDGAGNVVAERGTGKNTLLFLGHIDTVGGWIPVTVKDGFLWGRGSVDAKGSLAAFIAGAGRAARATQATQATPSGDLPLHLIMVGAVGEESDAHGALAIVDRYRPDWCVVGEPSGWEGITLGYKGQVRTGLTLSMPHGHRAGKNLTAVDAAMEFWRLLSEVARDYGSAGAGGFDQLSCSILRIASESDGLSDRVSLEIDFRLPPGVEGRHIEECLSKAAAGVAADIRWQTGNPQLAYRADKNNPLVRNFMFAIRDAGGRPRFKLKWGTSDMNIVGPVWKCPILAFGPGDSSLDHTPEERLSLDEYGRTILIWEQVLKGLASL